MRKLEYLESLEISMKHHMFSGDDIVQMFTFLAELTEEGYSLDSSETHAFLDLPYLLKETIKEQ